MITTISTIYLLDLPSRVKILSLKQPSSNYPNFFLKKQTIAVKKIINGCFFYYSAWLMIWLSFFLTPRETCHKPPHLSGLGTGTIRTLIVLLQWLSFMDGVNGDVKIVAVTVEGVSH